MSERTPTKPKGLGAAGARFWREVLAEHVLEPDKLRLLEAVCRTIDTITRLDDALVDAPLTVAGSMGQLREHPLLAEARQQRGLLARLLGQLGLPDAEADVSSEGGLVAPGVARSSAARRAALARWGR